MLLRAFHGEFQWLKHVWQCQNQWTSRFDAAPCPVPERRGQRKRHALIQHVVTKQICFLVWQEDLEIHSKNEGGSYFVDRKNIMNIEVEDSIQKPNMIFSTTLWTTFFALDHPQKEQKRFGFSTRSTSDKACHFYRKKNHGDLSGCMKPTKQNTIPQGPEGRQLRWPIIPCFFHALTWRFVMWYPIFLNPWCPRPP